MPTNPPEFRLPDLTNPINKIIKYFSDQWISNANIPLQVISVSSSVKWRTNCIAEGKNHYFKVAFGIHKGESNIFLIVIQNARMYN